MNWNIKAANGKTVNFLNVNVMECDTDINMLTVMYTDRKFENQEGNHVGDYFKTVFGALGARCFAWKRNLYILRNVARIERVKSTIHIHFHTAFEAMRGSEPIEFTSWRDAKRFETTFLAAMDNAKAWADAPLETAESCIPSDARQQIEALGMGVEATQFNNTARWIVRTPEATPLAASYTASINFVAFPSRDSEHSHQPFEVTCMNIGVQHRIWKHAATFGEAVAMVGAMMGLPVVTATELDPCIACEAPATHAEFCAPCDAKEREAAAISSLITLNHTVAALQDGGDAAQATADVITAFDNAAAALMDAEMLDNQYFESLPMCACGLRCDDPDAMHCSECIEATADVITAFDNAVHTPCDVCGGALPVNGVCLCEATIAPTVAPCVPTAPQYCAACGEQHIGLNGLCSDCDDYDIATWGGSIPADWQITARFERTNRDQPFTVNGIPLELRQREGKRGSHWYEVLYDKGHRRAQVYEVAHYDRKADNELWAVQYGREPEFRCDSFAHALRCIATCIDLETKSHAAKVRAFHNGEVMQAHGATFWWDVVQNAVRYFHGSDNLLLQLDKSQTVDSLKLTVAVFGKVQHVEIKWQDVTAKQTTQTAAI